MQRPLLFVERILVNTVSFFFHSERSSVSKLKIVKHFSKNLGTLEPWNFGTFEPSNLRTFEPWNLGTLEPWNLGTLGP